MGDHRAALGRAIEPVTPEPPSPAAFDEASSPSGPVDGVGLCLSGGGYRAMLFHAGALLRLNQLGYLAKLSRVSSVSGGSIISGLLGRHWSALTWDDDGRATNLVPLVLEPIIEMSKHTIDAVSVALGAVAPFHTIGDEVARHYKKHLFHDATLQDLPDDATPGNPRFVINSTSLQTGKLVRFSRPYIADYRVGQWFGPTTSLAEAVTASSAFPPMLSPYKLKRLAAGEHSRDAGDRRPSAGPAQATNSRRLRRRAAGLRDMGTARHLLGHHVGYRQFSREGSAPVHSLAEGVPRQHHDPTGQARQQGACRPAALGVRHL